MKPRNIALLAAVASVAALAGAHLVQAQAFHAGGTIVTPTGSVSIRVGNGNLEIGNERMNLEQRVRALESAVATLYAQQGYMVQQAQVAPQTQWECIITPFSDAYPGKGVTEAAARSAAAGVCRGHESGMFCKPEAAKCNQLQ
ncbi:MAG: hypothetical protein HY075_15870 [Deltaproteobacteria bacterium]|nr:hypothetical protein [Deltaproteobacteria bacterium]